ncbi:hypothetical protein MTR67_031241 [Solanum verrucosum]|uniref:Uncharacterized protein n=1 Tax=Solanum verrucosum TaxID=315347 RepID=A0AAF0U263_SOLVR|nr:hypothetical protein MTR67_031241 [Solanum verrucosum]
MEEHAEADSIDLEDSKIQWAAIKMSKKRTEQVSIKLSPSKGYMQNNIDDDQPIFLYSHKDERESSKQVDGYATTSKTFVFHRLGTKRKSLSERRLLEHENQDFCDVTDDKEIHSVFPSRMKRKVILSITTDESLKIKRTTIIFTNHFNGETKKEKDEAITIFVGSQREDSNLIQSSYHITVEEGPHIDVTYDDVQEAPPQLEDGVQSTIDDLKELYLGTLEDLHPTFVSALLTPEEERKLIE